MVADEPDFHRVNVKKKKKAQKLLMPNSCNMYIIASEMLSHAKANMTPSS